jgi:hypothetical protein
MLLLKHCFHNTPLLAHYFSPISCFPSRSMAPAVPWAETRQQWILQATDLLDNARTGVNSKLSSAVIQMRLEALAAFLVSYTSYFPTLIVKLPVTFRQRTVSRSGPSLWMRKLDRSLETEQLSSLRNIPIFQVATPSWLGGT